MTNNKLLNRLGKAVHFRTGAGALSPSSGVRPGAKGIFHLSPLTSFGDSDFSFKSKSEFRRSFRFSKPLALLRPVAGMLAVIFISILSFSFFSNSAYDSSYLNVSSTGSAAFGSIRPTASGASASASDTLTVHTDCTSGYKVYVSGQNGKDTNLTNSNSSITSNNTISTSSTAVGSTANALSSNTWCLNSENTSTDVGLPAYANAANTALTSKSSVSEESTVPI
ncbi:hypothetical protein IJ103_04300, partial [Candidatus Saccharibacteria bacterium]|nr:hypothetical protein [Candidatus Saccharibacteria bacterium]